MTKTVALRRMDAGGKLALAMPQPREILTDLLAVERQRVQWQRDWGGGGAKGT